MAEMHKKTAVITGPTGAVGTALAEVLLSHDLRVIAVLRPGSRRASAVPAGAEKVECDLSELENLPGLISGKADYFFHLGWTGTTGEDRNSDELQAKNVTYTLDACRAAASLHAEAFVFAGSQAEYGRQCVPLTPELPCHPENAYGRGKLAAGQQASVLCRDLGIRFIHARILSVYGPHDGDRALIPTLIRGLLAGESPALTEGRQIWDYLYESDAGEALYRMALYGTDGAVYPLGSGIGQPLKDYMTVVRDLCAPGTELKLGAIPYNERSVMTLTADIRKLREDTGFTPSVSFPEGIRRTISAIRKKDGI